MAIIFKTEQCPTEAVEAVRWMIEETERILIHTPMSESFDEQGFQVLVHEVQSMLDRLAPEKRNRCQRALREVRGAWEEQSSYRLRNASRVLGQIRNGNRSSESTLILGWEPKNFNFWAGSRSNNSIDRDFTCTLRTPD